MVEKEKQKSSHRKIVFVIGIIIIILLVSIYTNLWKNLDEPLQEIHEDASVEEIAEPAIGWKGGGRG